MTPTTSSTSLFGDSPLVNVQRHRSAERSGTASSDKQFSHKNKWAVGYHSKATLGKLPKDGVKRITMGFSERIDGVMN